MTDEETEELCTKVKQKFREYLAKKSAFDSIVNELLNEYRKKISVLSKRNSCFM